MKDAMTEPYFEDIGLRVPRMLLPQDPGDKEKMSRWATVACDQYTSQPEYWEAARAAAGDGPTTLDLMLPEIYLGEKDVAARIRAINGAMRRYLAGGLVTESEPCLMLVRRQTGASPERTGVVAALDLEQYSFEKGSSSLIRATEGTVAERIPPRMKVREEAAMELPHVMILIDDPEKRAVEGLRDAVQEKGLAPCYDFDLMMGGGHITGTRITDRAAIEAFAARLRELASPALFSWKYGVPEGTPVLLYAVGDGNHSLASAKCHWERLRENGAPPDHPARFALVEIVNVHDKGILFEPIHRILFGCDAEEFTDSLTAYFEGNASCVMTGIGETAPEGSTDGQPAEEKPYHEIPILAGGQCGTLYIDKKVHTLAAGALQPFLDHYLETHPACRIDYVHGDGAARSLAGKAGNLGLFLPPMPKGDLFRTVIRNGSLPRKTFSMGEAFEKRYYIEGRRITV